MQRPRGPQRPYVRLRPLAYVTGSGLRGSIGTPPEWGAEAYTAWSGHALAPDPRLVLNKVRVLFVPKSRDPVVSGPDPTQRVRDSSQGSGLCPWRFQTLPGGLVRKHKGPTLSHGGLDPLLMPWAYRLLWPRGSPGVVHLVGSGAACHATRDSRVGTAPSYRSRGYPYFRVPTLSNLDYTGDGDWIL
jgi:hypothetical protein